MSIKVHRKATGGSTIDLQTDGVSNGDQTTLNLVSGTNITLTDNGTGSVTIDATAGGGDTLLQQYNWWFTSLDSTYDDSYTFSKGSDTATLGSMPSRSIGYEFGNGGTDNHFALTIPGITAVPENAVEVRLCTLAGINPNYTANQDNVMFLGFSQSDFASMFTTASFTDAGNSCGFLVEWDTDAYKLKAYSSNATVTTEKTTIESLGDFSTTYRALKIVFTELTTLKFYVNGVLEATHTTNIPNDGGGDFAWAGVGACSGTGDEQFTVRLSSIDMQVHSVA